MSAFRVHRLLKGGIVLIDNGTAAVLHYSAQ